MQTFKLTCPRCGGKLEVDEDLERFACGYCGIEHVVVRKGGTVTIQPDIRLLEEQLKGAETRLSTPVLKSPK